MRLEPARFADEAAHSRPMIKALEHRGDGHDTQKRDQPLSPSGVAQFEEQDARGHNFLDEVVGARIGHGSASSNSSGAKWRSTLSAVASASVAGRQRG